MGRHHYWFAAIPLTDPDEGSDRWVVDNGMVALTPLRLDLTGEAWLQQFKRQPEIGTLNRSLSPDPSQSHSW